MSQVQGNGQGLERQSHQIQNAFIYDQTLKFLPNVHLGQSRDSFLRGTHQDLVLLILQQYQMALFPQVP
jgi:hypothetical protein